MTQAESDWLKAHGAKQGTYRCWEVCGIRLKCNPFGPVTPMRWRAYIHNMSALHSAHGSTPAEAMKNLQDHLQAVASNFIEICFTIERMTP